MSDEPCIHDMAPGTCATCMPEKEATRTFCVEPGCMESIPAHKWGQIKEGADWFFKKDGDAWCPKHIPDWVEEWRAKR